jgi:Cu/Ag efflux protein CusF
MRALRFLSFTLVLMGLTGCAKEAPKQPEVKHYDLHGEVLELDTKDHLAKIKHEKIGDWMGAMTMDFPIKEDSEFSALKVGQKIDATVSVQGLDYWVSGIHPQK